AGSGTTLRIDSGPRFLDGGGADRGISAGGRLRRVEALRAGRGDLPEGAPAGPGAGDAGRDLLLSRGFVRRPARSGGVEGKGARESGPPEGTAGEARGPLTSPGEGRGGDPSSCVLCTVYRLLPTSSSSRTR